MLAHCLRCWPIITTLVKYLCLLSLPTREATLIHKQTRRYTMLVQWRPSMYHIAPTLNQHRVLVVKCMIHRSCDDVVFQKHCHEKFIPPVVVMCVVGIWPVRSGYEYIRLPYIQPVRVPCDAFWREHYWLDFPVTFPTKHLYNIYTTSSQRLRHWSNIV